MTVVIRMTVAVVAVVAAEGCRPSGPPRYHVGGSVTFDGTPVPSGTVSFVPAGSGPDAQPYGFCEIKAGRYASRTGKSPGSGRYRAIVVGCDGVPYQTKIADAIVDHPHGKPVFPTHVVEVDLPPRHGGVFDFAVPREQR
ncbi:hypothetical protein EBR56_04395 [bacterium]|nr:hypothetical protein [bacterium]